MLYNQESHIQVYHEFLSLCRHTSSREYAGKFRNCAINTLWRDGNSWKLGFWGDTSHLDGVGVQAEAFGGGKGG